MPDGLLAGGAGPETALSSLDHIIGSGNSLLGTTPELIAGRAARRAFNPIEGATEGLRELKKRNRAEGKGLGNLFVAEDAERAVALRSAARPWMRWTTTRRAPGAQGGNPSPGTSLYDYIAASSSRCLVRGLRHSQNTIRRWLVKSSAMTQSHWDHPRPPGELAQGRDLPAELAAEVSLARRYQFFHWHTSFPEVAAEWRLPATSQKSRP